MREMVACLRQLRVEFCRFWRANRGLAPFRHPDSYRSVKRWPWYSQRPIKLALYNGVSKTIIDVDNVRLEDFLATTCFAMEISQTRCWVFFADSHLEWHVKSLPIAVLFELGWLGLIAIFVFSILAIKRASSRALQGDMVATAALASFTGFF